MNNEKGYEYTRKLDPEKPQAWRCDLLCFPSENCRDPTLFFSQLLLLLIFLFRPGLSTLCCCLSLLFTKGVVTRYFMITLFLSLSLSHSLTPSYYLSLLFIFSFSRILVWYRPASLSFLLLFTRLKISVVKEKVSCSTAFYHMQWTYIHTYIYLSSMFSVRLFNLDSPSQAFFLYRAGFCLLFD